MAMDAPATTPLDRLDLATLRERTSVKWRAFDPDVLPLWVAEMDVELAEPVVAALTDAVRRGDTGYAATSRDLAAAVADFAQERWGWEGPQAARSALVPDVMVGAVELLRLLTEPGDAVVVNPPVYPPFYAFLTSADRVPVEAPLGPAGRLDLAVLEEAYAAATRAHRRVAHLLCSPQNPTGVVHTRDELEAVAALADRYGVRVVSDEAHAPLTLPGARFTPYLAVDGGERGLAVLSAAKAWNLAGVKAALAVAGAEAASDLARLPEEVGHGVSHLGVMAHTAAFGAPGSRAWLDLLIGGLDRNRRLLADLLAEHVPDVRYRPPEATFLAWLDFRDDALGRVGGGSGSGPCDLTEAVGVGRLLRREGRVALSSGEAFGPGGAGHARLNFATGTGVLTEAVHRISRVSAQVKDASPGGQET